MNSFIPIFGPDRLAIDRFSIVIAWLCRAVAARISAGVAEALIVLIWQRLRRIDGQMQALAARFRAGKLRLGVERTGLRDGGELVCRARGKAGEVPPQLCLPRRFGWLLTLVPFEAANLAGQLRHLLADPEMVALLAATPRMARILRPLCRMLGVEPGVLVAMPVAASGVVTEGGMMAGQADCARAVKPALPLAVEVKPPDEMRRDDASNAWYNYWV